jgi:hypothetical protein
VYSLSRSQLFDIVLKIITNLSVIVGGIAAYIALRSNSRELGAQIFLAYSNRIHLLRQTLAIDVDVYRPLSDATDLDPEARRAAVEALYAIFEFYSLRRQGYVTTAIGSIWEADQFGRCRRQVGIKWLARASHRFEINRVNGRCALLRGCPHAE